MNPVILVQARMGSTRLPGKVLMDICGKPMIQHVMERCLGAFFTVLCTTELPEDEPLANLSQARGWLCYRGSVDPLSRLAAASGKLDDPAAVIRVSGDCPLIDQGLIRGTWEMYQFSGCFTTTSPTAITGFPDGQDVEVFSPRLLDLADKLAHPPEREHVTTYMRRRYFVHYLRSPPNAWPIGKWSVDTQDDLERMRRFMGERVP